jgi:hypothetical protein
VEIGVQKSHAEAQIFKLWKKRQGVILDVGVDFGVPMGVAWMGVFRVFLGVIVPFVGVFHGAIIEEQLNESDVRTESTGTAQHGGHVLHRKPFHGRTFIGREEVGTLKEIGSTEEEKRED